nr:hypothetical protein Itr_chr03CG02100 [Ipomoea trifida]
MADPITLSVSSSRQQLAPTKAAAATKLPAGASSSFPFHFSINGGCAQLVTVGQSIAEEIQPPAVVFVFNNGVGRNTVNLHLLTRYLVLNRDTISVNAGVFKDVDSHLELQGRAVQERCAVGVGCLHGSVPRDLVRRVLAHLLRVGQASAIAATIVNGEHSRV